MIRVMRITRWRMSVGVVAAGALAGAAGLAASLWRTTVSPHAEPVTMGTGEAADFSALMRRASVAKGAQSFARCGACHSIGKDGPDLEGPNLYAVLGQPIARRRTRYAYTAALGAVGGSWDMRRLDAWLTNPRRFAPGTSMTFPGIEDPAERADLIAYINSQGSHLPLP